MTTSLFKIANKFTPPLSLTPVGGRCLFELVAKEKKRKHSEEMKQTIRTHLENVLYGLICAAKKKEDFLKKKENGNSLPQQISLNGCTLLIGDIFTLALICCSAWPVHWSSRCGFVRFV